MKKLKAYLYWNSAEALVMLLLITAAMISTVAVLACFGIIQSAFWIAIPIIIATIGLGVILWHVM